VAVSDGETPMRVEIWSDVVCPWCFIGKRRFERAASTFGRPVDVEWRSFELNPAAPAVSDGGTYERIARKYGITVEQAQQQYERITQLAAVEGLEYHLDRARSGRSFDAHRLIHLARVHGIQDAVKERFLAAYLRDGVAIGLPEELAPVAVAAGLDADEVERVLRGDDFAVEVRADEERALDIGVTGVPFFLVDGRVPIPGAQEVETFVAVLERAWQRRDVRPA
jgi:predicted DsbA family dithiol-disulfide isomerase